MKPGTHYGKLSAPGPMARTVEDVALLLDVMTERDVRNRTHPILDEPHGELFADSVHGLRIAYSPRLGFDVSLDPEVEAACRRAAEALETLGAVVDERDPDVPDGRREAYDRMYFGTAAYGILELLEDETDADEVDPALWDVIRQHRNDRMLDWLAADATLVELAQRMSLFHTRFDLLVTPTVAVAPFEAGREVPRDWPDPRWTSWAVLTWPFNMTGQPACTVPCGFTTDGLPIGVQVIGPRDDDRAVLAAANAIQRMLPLFDRRPGLTHDESA